MIKIAALNNDLEEESGSEDEVTREALEQIALQQYSKSLDLQRKGNLKDATQLLRDLLDTELLYDVKKPAQGEKVVGPLFNLKYLCYKNLGSMLSEANDMEPAIEAYCAASELDDTDISLWHRLGQLCIRAKRYEMALHAFQRGADRNPRHWPCLDKIVTLLLGLDCKEECISTIHDTLLLDPSYLRGLAYRKHIYTTFPYIRDYMEYLNPIYKWSEKDEDEIDEEQALKLIKEADEIHEIFLEQQKSEQFKYKLPDLKLRKPITKFTWHSVGDSLVNMHHYMTENFYSHACFIELVFENEVKDEPMEVCEEPNKMEQVELKKDENSDTEKNTDTPESESETNNLSDKEKVTAEAEKVESDVEFVPNEPAAEATEVPPEPKKKTSGRRRGSDLVGLQQWGWYTKRRSGRKKPVNKQDNIYDTLRRMVPTCLTSENDDKKEKHDRATSPDTNHLDKLFDENAVPPEIKQTEEYFNTDDEQKDVKQFITKYTETKRDIIDMLKEFLSILASKWRVKWPENLPKVFIEANSCYNNHIDVPTCTDENKEELIHYVNVNILVEEFSINEKFNSEEKVTHELSTIEAIGITLYLKPHIFTGVECLDLILRQLWAKLHIHILNKDEEVGLDCLYQLLCEFEAMGEHHDTYNLEIVNFTFKPVINESEILANIKFLERNKKLSTVMELFDRGSYDEVLNIVTDSFEHCKTMARNQEEEVALDLAVQMSLILDTYWALDDVDNCFKWCLICLNEALKHYFRYTSGSPEYDKWTLTVVKILYSMEHILTTDGLLCLDTISQKELSQGLENLIRIIGHQVETNATEMPFGSVVPWIIMHYILQREEDQGRARIDKNKEEECEIPNPLLILFIAHEQLGNRGWCSKSEAKLLYFILDVVVPRLRTPILSKCLDQVNQYMEQCVFCLYGHPGKKNKLKYLVDHNATAHTLNWDRAQQVYEVFRPLELPTEEEKQFSISPDTETLFKNILALMPAEHDPEQYVPDIDKYIKGTINKIPNFPPLLPLKIRDIYFLLGDHYLKREEHKISIKYNILDVIVNSNRSQTWAEITLAKIVLLMRVLNSCKNINNDRDFLRPAKSIITCFKRTLELNPKQYNMLIEYGIFAYYVHSFCSRLLKQASESLSMEDFESLEKQKEELLDTTQKCFMTVLKELNYSHDDEKASEDWLYYYMLGKVAEKRNKPPVVYLDYYWKGVKSLFKVKAAYPSKINCSSPAHLCFEVLELHYRIHASILKYIEQHENKPISVSVGNVFTNYIEEWRNGPFGKKLRKEGAVETETSALEAKKHHFNLNSPVQQAASILKRSISDPGVEESHEAKRLKFEGIAAKVSCDTERRATVEAPATSTEVPKETKNTNVEVDQPAEKPTEETDKTEMVPVVETTEALENSVEKNDKPAEVVSDAIKVQSESKVDSEMDKKEDSSSSSSSSSSDSSSSDSSSDSTSDSSKDSAASTNSNDNKPLSDEELLKIASGCLDSLEDCASRFPPHYKAIYRVAHYHFYYKKGKDVERCRDLLLSNFTSRNGQKLGGLFSERNKNNFFNNVWKIPIEEIDRAGSFTFHMSRSVLLTMEVLKEFDDYKMLLDLSMQLQKVPDQDKTYLRDSDRQELAQQAFSLCLQSLKGLLTKFGQQPDLKSSEVEQQALKSLMLDIYRAYQRAPKQPSFKQFTNLLAEAFKLVTSDPITENMNLVDLSLRYCHKLSAMDKPQKHEKKQATKQAAVEATKATAVQAQSSATSQSKPESKPASQSTSAATSVPKMSTSELTAALQSYLPMLSDPILSQQTAAAQITAYLNNLSAFTGFPPNIQNSLQSTIQNSLQNSFQAEFYRQFLGQSFSSYLPPPVKKQKRAPKTTNAMRPNQPAKLTKAYSTSSKPNPTTSFHKTTSLPSIPKSTSMTKPMPQKAVSIPNAIQKPTISTSMSKTVGKSTLTPSMGTVLSSLPASLTANLTSYGAPHSSHSTSNMPSQAHLSSAVTTTSVVHTKPPLPHQQVSPGKTLQEKLAERQKHIPKPTPQEINASISKLPSSLTITKTKQHQVKKSLSFNDRPKPISSDEVIVLDDD